MQNKRQKNEERRKKAIKNREQRIMGCTNVKNKENRQNFKYRKIGGNSLKNKKKHRIEEPHQIHLYTGERYT